MAEFDPLAEVRKAFERAMDNGTVTREWEGWRFKPASLGPATTVTISAMIRRRFREMYREASLRVPFQRLRGARGRKHSLHWLP